MIFNKNFYKNFILFKTYYYYKNMLYLSLKALLFNGDEFII